MITIIAAITADRGAIGRNGDLIFHIPADLRHFKTLTSGHTVVMGRKTFESLPKGALPNRRNIVISSRDGFTAPGTETAHSLDEALAMAGGDGREVFIIGGGRVYAEALDKADRLELTIVHAPTPDDADTFFPDIDPAKWQLTANEDFLTPAADAPANSRFIPHSFATFSRI